MMFGVINGWKAFFSKRGCKQFSFLTYGGGKEVTFSLTTVWQGKVPLFFTGQVRLKVFLSEFLIADSGFAEGFLESVSLRKKESNSFKGHYFS